MISIKNFRFQKFESLLPTTDAPFRLSSGLEVQEVHREQCSDITSMDVKLAVPSHEYVNTAVRKEGSATMYDNLKIVGTKVMMKYTLLP